MRKLKGNLKIGNQYRIYPGSKSKHKKHKCNDNHAGNGVFLT